jgi:hypothetical protein
MKNLCDTLLFCFGDISRSDLKMSKDEIDVEFRSIKKIIIFEVLELSKEELFRRVGLFGMSGQMLALHWAEGLIFLVIPFHIECDSVIKEAMKGNFYISNIMFASMPKYNNLQKIGGVEIPIIDETPSRHYREIAKKIKERKYVRDNSKSSADVIQVEK